MISGQRAWSVGWGAGRGRVPGSTASREDGRPGVKRRARASGARGDEVARGGRGEDVVAKRSQRIGCEASPRLHRNFARNFRFRLTGTWCETYGAVGVCRPS